MMDMQDFVVEVLSRGAYFDGKAGDGSVYQIDTFTLRLNHIALNAYLLSDMMNCRECYSDSEDGQTAFEEDRIEHAARRKRWGERVADQIGVDLNAGSFVVTQALAEVFAAVWIRELEG
jgi:hypothetical protein